MNKKNILKNNKIRLGFAFVVLIAVLMSTEISFGDTVYIDYEIKSFYSEVYDISELGFVWSGDTGTAQNPSLTNGGSGNGTLSTTYSDEGTKNVQVYAVNSDGEQVSAAVFCSYEPVVCGNGFVPVNGICVPELSASCSAFNNAAGTGNPQLFFGPGESVYWKAEASGGDDPYSYVWSGDATSSVSQISGPYVVGPGGDYVYSDVSSVYTAEVEVRDRQTDVDDTACSISVKECNTNTDCPSDEICRLDTFTCGPPLPVVVEPLYLRDPIVNLGQQCDMSWEIEGAFTCELYKNGVRLEDNSQGVINGSAPTSTASFLVDPGSYLLRCENEVGDTIDAGPARCLLNPQIRES